METESESSDHYSQDPRALKKLRNVLKRQRKAETDLLERKILKKKISDLKVRIDSLNGTDAVGQESDGSGAEADTCDSSHPVIPAPVMPLEEAARPSPTHRKSNKQPTGENDAIPPQGSQVLRIESSNLPIDPVSTDPIQGPCSPPNLAKDHDTLAAPKGPHMPDPTLASSAVCLGRPHAASQDSVAIRDSARRRPAPPRPALPAMAASAHRRAAGDSAGPLLLPRSAKDLFEVLGPAQHRALRLPPPQLLQSRRRAADLTAPIRKDCAAPLQLVGDEAGPAGRQGAASSALSPPPHLMRHSPPPTSPPPGSAPARG
jgi:hypothetical protein